MIFHRREKRGAVPPHLRAGAPDSVAQAEFYKIDFEMMVKGSIVKRRGGEVRQFGVTVDGSTRLVTSGDTVDRATYDALLAAGAIRVPSQPQPDIPRPAKDRAEPFPDTF